MSMALGGERFGVVKSEGCDASEKRRLDGRIMRQRNLNAQIYHAVVGALLFAAILSPIAWAEDSEDASYFCTREMAAGLAYNSSLEKWEGVKLPSGGSFSRFIFRMKFLGDRVQRNSLDENEDVNDYEVTVTEAETNTAFSCRSAGTGIHSKIVVVGEDDNVVCSARNYNYTLNRENNRFVSVYLHGYVDGVDSNENTPMVSGGTCTKIDQTK